MVSAARAASGSFTLSTPRSALLFQLTLGAAGELLGSTLRGSLAAADALALGLASLPSEPVRLGPAAVFVLDLRLAGTLARPGAAGRVTSARASFDLGDSLTLALEDISVLLDVDPDRIAWQRLTGRFCGGTFSSSGRIALGAGGSALRADVAWRGVRVQDLPTGALGERALATVLRGVSSGELRFERRGLPGQGLGARGRVTIAQPAYRFARSLAPALARYGLPPIRTRGEGPLVATVRLDGGEILVEPLTAAVEAAELDGALRLGLDGRLLGRVRVHVHERYLAGSPILAVPAALMGKVTIPVDLGGTLDDPELRTDALEILDGLLARRGRPGVGGAVRGVLESLRNVTRPAAQASLTPTVAPRRHDKDGRMATPRAQNARRTGAVIVLYNILYWPYLILSCAVLFWPALLLFLATLARDPHRRLLHRFTSAWGGHYLARAPLAGVSVEGRERVPEGRPYVYVSNHQSMVDILAVFATGLDYKWVSKVENFYAPFIGWNMALNGYVPLRRGHLPSILRMFRRCEAALARGDSVFVFPEGTRSPDGNLQSFFRGAFVLSARNKAPVVPVVIDGTGEILGKGSTRIVPRPVRVSVLAPVDPASVAFDDRRLSEVVHDQMEAELARLRGRG